MECWRKDRALPHGDHNRAGRLSTRRALGEANMRSNVCRAARRIHSFPRLSLSAADRRRSFEQQKVVRFPVCVAESREYLAGQQHPLTTVSRCRRFQPSTAPCPMLIVTPSFSRGAPPHALWRGAPLAQAPRTSSSRPRSAWGTSISPPPSVREPFAHIYPEDRVATGLVTALPRLR